MPCRRAVRHRDDYTTGMVYGVSRVDVFCPTLPRWHKCG
jgi:hypothetical protein